MSKFGESLGIWDTKVNGIEYQLKPTMNDVLEFRSKAAQASNSRTGKIDLGILDATVSSIFERLILQAEPNMALDDRKGLKDYITVHLDEIRDEMSVALKQTTKEEIEKEKAELKLARRTLFGFGTEEDKKKN